MSINAMTTGLAGMQAAQRGLDVSAGRIAGLSTPAYQAQQAQQAQQIDPQAPAPSGSDVVSLSAAAIAGTSGTFGEVDMNKEVVDQIGYQHNFALSAKLVQTTDDMLGTLVNLSA